MKFKLVVLLVLSFSLCSFSQSIPPILSNFRIDQNQATRVYFDTSEIITGSSTIGFVISGKSIVRLKINPDQTTGHYFEVSKPFNFWDNNTIRYEGGSNIKNKSSSSLGNFTLQYIKNGIPEPVSGNNIYYVSAKGQNSSNGLSESNPWRTINHAAQIAKAGDVVYIRAGDYSNENVVVKNSGQVDNPIKFIGYKNSINDKPVLVRNQTTKFSSTEMPYIHSSSGSGTGFNLSGKKYIVVKNLQVEGYNDCVAIKSKASYNLLENIYTKGGKRMGINGFSRDGVNNRFKGCYIANAGGAGIRIAGERHLIDDFYVSSYGVQSMDYYISLYGGTIGTGSIIMNSDIVRDPKDSHTGHGISVKAEFHPLEYTLIENCNLHEVAQAIELRHHQVRYTVVRNVKATGNRNSNSNLITFRDDTNNNSIENCTATGVYEAIRFTMNKGEDKGVQGGGHYNKIINTVFDNCKFNITMNGFGATPLESTNNEFLNCTFYGSNYMFALPINYGSTNKFMNCVFDNVKKDVYGSSKLSAEFTYCNFYQGYKMPNGNGNLSVNPNFENSLQGNFRLKSNSPLIDKGKKLNDVKLDFEGKSRPQGNSLDIGAFEYQDQSQGSIKAFAGEDQNICLGQKTTLTATGGKRYEWSNGEKTATITVSPEKTTTYGVKVYDGASFDTDDLVIYVEQVIADAGEDISITKGASVSLTASGGESYLWSNGQIENTISVSPSETTTYSVKVKKGDCEDIDELVVTVKEDVIIPVVADAGSDKEICFGDEIVLTANGGTQFLWSNGETKQSIVVSPKESKSFKVTVSDEFTSDTDEVQVIVNKVEGDAGDDVTIYVGDAVKLTANGGSSYLWNNGETTPSITVSPSQTETFSVQISSGDCQKTDEVKVVVSTQVSNPPPPNANAGEDQTICLGETVTLNAFGGTTFLWNTGQMSKSITVSPTRTTTYELIATRGGVDDSDKVTIVVENCKKDSDSEILTARDVQAYPNPTTGILKLNATNVQSDIDIHLINMNGKILYHDKIRKNNGGFSKQLDLSNFTKGIYFVRFTNAEQNAVKKIVLI